MLARLDGAAVSTPKPVGGKTRVAVLVDPALTGEPVAILLEQQLATRTDLSLVERQKLGLVIDGAALQRLAGDDRTQRVSGLRALQSADAIAVLRATGNQELELSVCDTRRGLLLWRLSLPRDGSGAERSEALAEEVARRLPVLMRQDVQIWAVPPLISRNLTSEHDHLKAGLSRLIEMSLLARGDALCVELSEAKALAEEVALGETAGARLRREVTLPRSDAKAMSSRAVFHLLVLLLSSRSLAATIAVLNDEDCGDVALVPTPSP